MVNPLKNYRILLADSDLELAWVFRKMLMRMGFGHVELTRSGEKAVEMLRDKPFDFVITDFNLDHLDGLQLLSQIRRAKIPGVNGSLPVVMLTGRAEMSDVAIARDAGINEYVVKPFSARDIYNRLERIIEHPRHFVVAPTFVGPDRRTKKKADGELPENRRVATVQPQIPPPDLKSIIHQVEVPKLWLPDFTLKKKLGKNVTLASLVTPAVLMESQNVIDAISEESMNWIKDNMAELKFHAKALAEEKNPHGLIKEIGQVALTMNSRAGTFGYKSASEVAYMLFLFCRSMQPAHVPHHTIVYKHIDVLQVILSNHVRKLDEKDNHEIIHALKTLAKR